MDTWANSTDLEHFPGKLRNLAGFFCHKTWPQNGAADELRSEAMMRRRPSLKKLKRQILGEVQSWLFNQRGGAVTDWKATINITHIYIHQYRKSVSIFWMRQELEANRKSEVKDKVPLHLLVLSPAFAVAAALRQAPWISNHTQITAMGGSLWHGINGTGPPVAEWNVRAEPWACLVELEMITDPMPQVPQNRNMKNFLHK